MMRVSSRADAFNEPTREPGYERAEYTDKDSIYSVAICRNTRPQKSEKCVS
jgi:hypothetical protein